MKSCYEELCYLFEMIIHFLKNQKNFFKKLA